MRYVLFNSEGVYYKGIDSTEGVDCDLRHGFGIGDVGQSAEAETNDVELVMVDRKWHHLYAGGMERM